MEYAVILEPADDGSLGVWVPDLPGRVSTGDTGEEALANMSEAIRGHVEALRAMGEPVPPARSSAGIVKVA